MFNFLIDGFKNLKKSKKILIIIFLVFELLLLALMIPTGKQVMSPGANDLAHNSIEINNDYENISNINTVSVTTYYNANLLQLIIASLDNKFEITDTVVTNEKEREIAKKQGAIQKRASLNAALIYAYEKASLVDPSISIDYTFRGLIVSKVSKTNPIEQGDVITEIENTKITSLKQYKEILTVLLKNKEVNDIIKVKIYNPNGNDLECNLKVYKEKDIKLLGLELYEDFKIGKAKPEYKEQEKNINSSGGPSGGAMYTLSLYTRLIKKDITKGLNIIGTGTINIDGTIGSIGKVNLKTLVAYYKNFDIFFVEGTSNYKEALEACELYNIDPSFIHPVNSFDDILERLGGTDE